MTSMNETTICQIQSALDRFRQADVKARDELIALAYERLRHLTSRLLDDYRLRPRGEETGDVLHLAMLRFLRALEQVQPLSARDFLGLAATQIRRELIDLTRRYYGRKGHEPPPRRAPDDAVLHEQESPETNAEPDWLAAWTELHQRIAELPPEEREVVELLWYLGLRQEEAAQALNVDKSTIKRRWRAARARLADVLQGWLPQA
jgi:RNA polymerase sigma-70 factor (ECF subfamily)